jgi:nucleoid-associated protein YgaU
VATSLPSPPPDATVYTLVAGDPLWKIAADFYGHGNLFSWKMRIPSSAGGERTIPAA